MSRGRSSDRDGLACPELRLGVPRCLWRKTSERAQTGRRVRVLRQSSASSADACPPTISTLANPRSAVASDEPSHSSLWPRPARLATAQVQHRVMCARIWPWTAACGNLWTAALGHPSGWGRAGQVSQSAPSLALNWAEVRSLVSISPLERGTTRASPDRARPHSYRLVIPRHSASLCSLFRGCPSCLARCGRGR